MKQPQKHPERVKEKDIQTLLVDGNGLFKLAIEGDKNTFNTKNQHIGGIYQFMVQLRNFIRAREWDYVYVFWDGDFSGRLRYLELDEYKGNRNKVYGEYGLSQMQFMSAKMAKLRPEERHKELEFQRQKQRLQTYLPELFIRQITDKVVEADDFIAHYVNNKLENELITIITGDRDIFQLLDKGIAIYDLSFGKRKLILDFEFKNEYGYRHDNIKVQKILIGDNSDNIKGVKGLGKDTLFKHFPEFLTRKVELDEVLEKTKILVEERAAEKKKPLQVFTNILNQVTDGSQGDRLYEINDKIIDLKKPMLTNEALEFIEAYRYAPIDPEGRSIQNLYKLMIEDDIYRLFNDSKFVDFFLPFKKYMDKEIVRYNESLK